MAHVFPSIFILGLLLASASAACECPILEADICDKCTCSNEGGTQIINCKDEGISQVPTFTSSPMDYHEVTLAGNIITAIPADKFRELHALKKLDITGNPIVSIDNRAFGGLNGTLEELLLEVSSMTVFPKAALSGLSSLQTLSATGFDLSSSGLPAGALENLHQLSDLDLQSNRLRLLAADAFSGLEDTLEQLVLDSNEITSIPTSTLGSLPNLEYLSLLANDISGISANAFQGSTNLAHLDLSQNGMSNIDVNAFAGLEGKLENLTMRTCQLSDTMVQSVKGLFSLRDLELSENPAVANIPDSFFSLMSKLETLNLHNCGLHTLRSGTFTGLSALTALDVGSNNLASVHEDTFTSTPRLQSLHLGLNPGLAAALPQGVFHPVDSVLETLNLEETSFSDSHWSITNELTNLRTFHLTNNVIGNLPNMGFAKQTFLDSIYLGQNSMSVVTQAGLYGPNNHLTSINFNANSIKTLGECVFFEFTEFEPFLLNLNNNPLHCDCQMTWLLERLQEHEDFDFMRYTLDWTCSTPPNLANKKFAQELVLSDLVCDPPISIEPCLDLSPTIPTAPSTVATGEPSSERPYYFRVNITDVSDVEMSISWEVGDTDGLSGFMVQYKIIDGEKMYEEFSSSTRDCVIDGLEPSTQYIVCVQALGVNWPIPTADCDDVTTMPPSKESTTGGDNTIVIVLSCCLVVLVVIAIIVTVVVVKRKQEKKKATENGYQNNSLGVRIGGDSKRFSKPRSQTDIRDTAYFQNKDNVAFEHKLEGFSVEERNRILGLISQNGASTLSMISNASSHRYRELPEPPGAGASYLNPVGVTDDLDRHVYCEIPGESNYNEIPDSFI